MDTESHALDQHATALGHVAATWSTLQDRLAHLFSAVICDGHISEVALAAWHCHKSDHAQRDMLIAASSVALATRPELRDEIVNLRNHVEGLANARNDFIHASYSLLNDRDDCIVVPHVNDGNPRSKSLATRLNGIELIPAMSKFREKIIRATEACGDLFQCVVDPERTPSPERPWKQPRPRSGNQTDTPQSYNK